MRTRSKMLLVRMHTWGKCLKFSAVAENIVGVKGHQGMACATCTLICLPTLLLVDHSDLCIDHYYDLWPRPPYVMANLAAILLKFSGYTTEI